MKSVRLNVNKLIFVSIQTLITKIKIVFEAYLSEAKGP
jgi:hypothetical protein